MVWDEVEQFAGTLENADRRVTCVVCEADDAPDSFTGVYGNATVEKGSLLVITNDGEKHTNS